MKDTTDIQFASFLRAKGIPLANYDVIARGKGKFYFDLDEERWKELKLERDNSLVAEVDQHMKRLKDLLF